MRVFIFSGVLSETCNQPLDIISRLGVTINPEPPGRNRFSLFSCTLKIRPRHNLCNDYITFVNMQTGLAEVSNLPSAMITTLDSFKAFLERNKTPHLNVEKDAGGQDTIVVSVPAGISFQCSHNLCLLLGIPQGVHSIPQIGVFNYLRVFERLIIASSLGDTPLSNGRESTPVFGVLEMTRESDWSGVIEFASLALNTPSSGPSFPISTIPITIAPVTSLSSSLCITHGEYILIYTLHED